MSGVAAPARSSSTLQAVARGRAPRLDSEGNLVRCTWSACASEWQAPYDGCCAEGGLEREQGEGNVGGTPDYTRVTPLAVLYSVSNSSETEYSLRSVKLHHHDVRVKLVFKLRLFSSLKMSVCLLSFWSTCRASHPHLRWLKIE